MKIRAYILLLFIFCIACTNTSKDKTNETDNETATEISFDKTKWRTKKGRDYPYRDLIVNEIVYNDTVRMKNKDGILELLGEPDRINDGHLYYMIAQKRLGFWPLHTKTLVIKLSNDSTINWIKIHD